MAASPRNRWVIDEAAGNRRACRFGARGEVLYTCAWPRAVSEVVSPYLSWDNLDFVGSFVPTDGAGQPRDEIGELARVIARRKPLANPGWLLSAPSSDPAIAEFYKSTLAIRALAARARALPGLVVRESYERNRLRGQVSGDWLSVLICLDARYRDLFDLSAVKAAYAAAGLAVAKEIPNLAGRSIESGWLPGADPRTELEVAALGLCLGYPVGSSIAFILRRLHGVKGPADQP
jgi:hypothetical protein